MVINGNAKEFEGTTVEEAIQKAVAQLRVPKERMDVKVVCEEKKGLFGMRGAKLAKIKVALKK
ncbi:MAG TPA: Jag N-terminal domain-containing protein [Candidatus Omnitrophota bacterium]|nr:Jag N-terminal domain-containing protein [Candidatus Omnitrophota bacterium]